MTSEKDYKGFRKPLRWEYCRTQVDANKIKESDGMVSQLGREGWEMVNVVFTQTYLHFWFKREVS